MDAVWNFGRTDGVSTNFLATLGPRGSLDFVCLVGVHLNNPVVCILPVRESHLLSVWRGMYLHLDAGIVSCH